MNKLPDEFVKSIAKFPGLAEALATTEPDVAVRVNVSKPTVPAQIAGDAAVDPAIDPVPWCPNGYYLASRPQFALDPAWHQGRYYVQDASSMYVHKLLTDMAFSRPVRFLDACAAPGGKTTTAIDALPAESLIVANEYVPKRAAILRENLEKWGSPYCVITQGDTDRFARLQGFFDVALVDAPCSGEGMMRKDAEAVAQWSPALVAQCAERQRQIVDNIWPSIAGGGYLIYSTCTFNEAENEQIVDYLVAQHGAEVVAAPRRFLPSESRGEGLCVAVLRKGDAPQHKAKANHAKKSGPPLKSPFPLAARNLAFEAIGDNLIAVPAAIAADVEQLRQAAKVISAGVTIATIIRGRDPKKPVYVPAHHLVMSPLLNRGAFPEVNLTRAQALEYLRGNDPSAIGQEPLDLSGVSKGIVMLAYDGYPLGLAKNLGNRLNNLYPSAYRLRI